MGWQTIKKAKGHHRVQPNLLDYDVACVDFSWENISSELSGLEE